MTKREILNNLTIVKSLLNDIVNDIEKALEDKEDGKEIGYRLYNTSKIKRNRVVINEKLKELEMY